ncbi:MAG: transposase family protein, partial [bacterium]|nr:transposase family protein [bacterium]
WPFSWWVAVVIDHYSRRVMDTMIFKSNPTSESIQHFLAGAIEASATPKYIICDKGKQFWCDMFKDWCDRHGITPRFGAVGQHGSIAVVERLILSLKQECTRVIVVPFRKEPFRQELTYFMDWYNQNRPHSTLDGKTPDEIYHTLRPASECPRLEPRSRWRRTARCAFPQAPVAGQCGARIRLDVRYYRGRKHLPVVALRRAA